MTISEKIQGFFNIIGNIEPPKLPLRSNIDFNINNQRYLFALYRRVATKSFRPKSEDGPMSRPDTLNGFIVISPHP